MQGDTRRDEVEVGIGWILRDGQGGHLAFHPLDSHASTFCTAEGVSVEAEMSRMLLPRSLSLLELATEMVCDYPASVTRDVRLSHSPTAKACSACSH